MIKISPYKSTKLLQKTLKSKHEILCLHYYYPPVRSGAVLRNYYFSTAFSPYFEKIHVLTSDNAQTREKEPLILPNNLHRYEVRTMDYRSLKRFSKHKPTGTKSSSTFQFLTKIQKTLPFHFIIGEGSLVYIYSAYKKAKELIKKNNISMIYSSFMPYADHLIAFLLKRKFPNLIWVADFRDLQVEPMYKNIYFEKLNRRIEKYLLKNVDLITTISSPFADYLSVYGRTLSVPKGVAIRSYNKKKNDKFKIVYTGHLAGEFRDGKYLINALKILNNKYPDKFQFIYAGRDGDLWKKWFEEKGIIRLFEDRGFIPRNETLNLQEESDLLLLLTSSTPNYKGVFTGKLFEYLETKSPIINIINGIKDDVFEELFNELNAGKIIYNNEPIESLVNYIEYLYINPIINKKNIDLLERKYTWDYRAKSILKAINLIQ